ncbi:MAG: ISAs1 family transposase [Proteobacteria bacterium]|uniref:ISAs1 family transposase n=1 Tax=Candidatus Avisuccinivibrio stercorigallinarum TaxID=2840704 RepID=A0A9D9GU30_9GAMM|nr:ISAs1 family transposase [Candidatus Avisuccinivibrio stercorigallinarum]
MKPTDDLLAIIPAEFHGDKLRCTWHAKQATWYVYRVDDIVYDPVKQHSIDKRTQFGKIKDGKWTYSPSWLKNREIEQLKKQLEAKKDDVDRAMENPATAYAVEHLKEITTRVPDPRQQLKTVYRLDHILTVMCLGMLGGFTGAMSLADYWSRYRYQLCRIMDDFPDEDISHDTINRLLRLIKPEHFLPLMSIFTSDLISHTSERLIHVDGKAVRASKTDDAKSGRYLLNVYDSGSRMFVAHELIGAKNNEISVVVDLLKKLDLKPGDIMTADAMHTQRATVAYLQSIGVGYCLAAKDNQEKLASEIMRHFAAVERRVKTHTPEPESGHDRIEIRETEIMPGSIMSKKLKDQWPGLAGGSIVKTTTQRIAKNGDKPETLETRYFICTIPYKSENSEKRIAEVVRSHWSVENQLHWVLDVVFGEDRIHASDVNYINNRSMCLKAASNILRTIQKIMAERGVEISISRLKEQCATPMDAMEVLGCFFEKQKIPFDVND